MTRKEAIREFKERKTPRGIFCIKCLPTGETWAGHSPNLNAARNGLWFALRLGTHFNKELQSIWKEHGEEAFTFDVVETFDDDLAPMTLSDLYKSRTKHWVKNLGAKPVV